MSLWSPLQVLFIVSLYVIYAEITTQPFVTVEDYYSYGTFPIGENETLNETEKENIVFPSVFNLSIYDNACNGDEVNDTRRFCETLKDDERETCEEFLDVVMSMMEFSCYLSEYEAEVAMNKSTDYLNNCQESQTCAESVEIVNILLEGLKLCNATEGDYMDLAYIVQNIKELKQRIGPMNETYAWELIVEQQTLLINNLEKYIHSVEDLLKYLKGQNLVYIFLTKSFAGRTNLAYFQSLLSKQKDHLLYCQEKEATWKKIDVVRFDVRLATFLIFFIVGVTGNILLLAVFIKYPDMRTTANIMLINLTVVDCICLVFNLPLTYFKATSVWSLGLGGCQVFYFIRYLTICISTYSVVMISVQRFLAVTRFPTANGCTIGEKTKTIIMLSGVLLLGVLYSLPHLIFSEITKGMCSDVNDDLIGIITTTDLVMICVVPTLLMAVFSFLTSSKIKKSVANPTGERTGQEKLRQNRMLSAHVLAGLAVLFVVSYFPSFLLYFITFQIDVKLGDLDMYVVDTVTYLLQFTNSCLNPVALCIMSRKYRKYFQEILSCCKIPLSLQKSLATSDASMSTTESSI